MTQNPSPTPSDHAADPLVSAKVLNRHITNILDLLQKEGKPWVFAELPTNPEKTLESFGSLVVRIETNAGFKPFSTSASYADNLKLSFYRRDHLVIPFNKDEAPFFSDEPFKVYSIDYRTEPDGIRATFIKDEAYPVATQSLAAKPMQNIAEKISNALVLKQKQAEKDRQRLEDQKLQGCNDDMALLGEQIGEVRVRQSYKKRAK